MNAEELLKAFSDAGLDTYDKVFAALNNLSTQSELKRIDIELDNLNAKRIEALKPLEDRRIELQNMRAQLAESLSK